MLSKVSFKKTQSQQKFQHSFTAHHVLANAARASHSFVNIDSVPLSPKDAADVGGSSILLPVPVS
jgi:hypothetical protein